VTTDQEKPDELEQKIARWAARSIPIAAVVAAVIAGVAYDLGTAVLVLAFGALLGTVALFWASLRALSGDVPLALDDALALAAPVVAEEQKRAVLAAIRDLEYDKSVGKISEADYRELLARYRADAKRLLQSLDEDLAPLRARAEAYLAGPGGKRGAKPRSKPAPARPQPPICPACKTENDDDAAFCKKCGAKLSFGGDDHAKA
jgi:hypothetical protein